MKDFLNRYMASNRDLGKNSEHELEKIFLETTSLILNFLGDGALRPERAVNAAFADALMVGVATAIIKGVTPDDHKLQEARVILLGDDEFLSAITTGTSQKAKVELRIARAINTIGS